MQTDLAAQLIAEIQAGEAMPFEQFVERALYDPEHGFYAAHGQAGGRTGDFVTSVEVGPLFASVIADWLDGVWRDLGSPTEFRVTEAGAGVGTLFRGINRAQPECFGALTYSLVERSAAIRQAHQTLPTSRWRSLAALPAESQHVVLANELLDNLAFGIAERVEAGWAPVMVDVDGSRLALEPTAADAVLAGLGKLAPDALLGTRVPTSHEAMRWVESARALAHRVLVFDYAASTAELAARGQSGWLRTFAGHHRASDPLAAVGQCDITHDVPTDQLPTPALRLTQADWLNANGLPERVQAARDIWAERGHIGDLEAMVARSALNEAEALTDIRGLGAFLALEWRSS